MQIIVQTITDSAIDLADMRNSQFIDQSGQPGTELIRYANMAYKDLYQQIVTAYEDYLVTSSQFNLVPNQDTYPLPADFYKLNGVDLIYGTNIVFTLEKYMFKQRNEYRNSYLYNTSFFGPIYKYNVVGGNIVFIPLPQSSNAITLWYTPNPVTITSFSDTLSLPIGGDEYMSLYMAAAMMAKEESDNSQLNGKRKEVLDQLKNSLRNRDAGSPTYIVDDSAVNSNLTLLGGNWGGY